MIFRNAQIKDLEIIAEIENVCFPANEAATKESIEKRILTFPENFWVLEVDNKIVGYINGMVTDNQTIVDEMFENVELHDKNGKWQSIFGLAVSPDYRKSGYAGQLINHLIEKSKDKNREGITLTCKEYLIPYYEKFGFVDLGVSASVHGGEVWHDMILTL